MTGSTSGTSAPFILSKATARTAGWLTAGLLLAALLIACATTPRPPPTLADRAEPLLKPLLWDVPAPQLLLLGEQHDAPEHHVLEQASISYLLRYGRLQALVLEMVERGRSTEALKPYALEEEVRRALNWQDDAWPWTDYRLSIMTAVRANVPVIGANLPHGSQRDVMRDLTLDRLLSAPALQRQMQWIEEGHCGLLVQTQVLPMTRIQIARDLSMAQTLEQTAARYPQLATDSPVSLRPLILLLAGARHVDRELGVPHYLDPELSLRTVRMVVRPPEGEQAPPEAMPADPRLDAVWFTAPLPPKDYCAEFGRQRAPASAPASAPPSAPATNPPAQ